MGDGGYGRSLTLTTGAPHSTQRSRRATVPPVGDVALTIPRPTKDYLISWEDHDSVLHYCSVYSHHGSTFLYGIWLSSLSVESRPGWDTLFSELERGGDWSQKNEFTRR